MAVYVRFHIPGRTAQQLVHLSQLVGCSVNEAIGALILEAVSARTLLEAEMVVRDHLREYQVSITEDQDAEGVL